MNTFDNIIEELIKFRDERNWKQFHTPENLAKSIVIEAGELLECFQWNPTNAKLKDVEEELADILIYSFYLANYYNLDIKEIINKKIKINEIMTLEELFNENQKLFTHTWGYKQEIRNDFKKRKDFCIRCIKRIFKDYPEYKEVIMDIKELKEYLNEL